MTLKDLLKLGDKVGVDQWTVYRSRKDLCVDNFAAYAYGPLDCAMKEEPAQYLKAILKMAPALLRLAVVVESAVDETNRFESWGEPSYEWGQHRDEIEAALDLVGEAME